MEKHPDALELICKVQNELEFGVMNDLSESHVNEQKISLL